MSSSAPSSNFVYQDLKKSRKSGVKSSKGAEKLRLRLTRKKKARWREANGVINRSKKGKQIQRRMDLAKEMAHEKTIDETVSAESLCEMFSPGVDLEVIQRLAGFGDSAKVGPEMMIETPVSAADAMDNLDITDSDLESFLQANFKHSSFRTGQLDAIKSVLCSTSTNRRSLVVLPTGTGKSLCYQFPSVYMRKRFGQTYLTIVVSPLIALMTDQLKQLPRCVRGAVLHSNLSPMQAHLVCKAVQAGEVDILFAAPERLLMYSTMEVLLGGSNVRIFLVAIDEAHCLSEWSHTFRPAYLRLPKLIDEELKPTALLALTATATIQTVSSIQKTLSISKVVRTDGVLLNEEKNGDIPMDSSSCASFSLSSVQRTNLELFARRSPNPSMDFLDFLNDPQYRTISPIIIYVAYQWQTDAVSQMLRENGLGAAEGYHGGLSSKERREIYEKFMCNKLRFVVATIAFGMGIDKSDVRAVVHLTLPKSVESYVQETGRCARDFPNSGVCRCYFNSEDFARIRNKMVVEGIRMDGVVKIVEAVFEPKRNNASNKELPVLSSIEGACAKVLDEEIDQDVHVVYVPEKIPNFISSQHLSLVLALLEREPAAGFSVSAFQGFPKIIKLRFFKNSMQELAEIDPFVDHMFRSPTARGGHATVKEHSGVCTVDVLSALARTKLSPPAFMHKLNACARAQKFAVEKSDWGHMLVVKSVSDGNDGDVTADSTYIPQLVDRLSTAIFASASAHHLFELNRLDACFVLMSRIAAESFENPRVGHKLIQQYFEARERVSNGDDLVPSLLVGASAGFTRNLVRELEGIRNCGNVESSN